MAVLTFYFQQVKVGIFLTIFTATYNRAYILPRLYQSLKTQGRTDFEWIVVDDGSIDGTKTLVDGWTGETEFSIKYIHQEHGGIARAYNRAVKEASAPFFLVMASDDVLAEGGLDLIYDNLHNLDDREIIYLIFPCSPINGSRNIVFPATGSVLKWYQFSADYHCETATVYRTDVLRNYLYPEFYSEMYISPDYIFYQMSERYSGYVIDVPLRLIEYLPDGITYNRGPIKCANFQGWTLVKNQNLRYSSGFKSRFKSAGVYDAYAILSGRKHFISSSARPFWALMALPAGIWYMVSVILMWRVKNK